MNNGVVRDRDNNFSRHQTFKDGVTIEGGLTVDITGGSNAEETADFTAESGKVYIVDTSSAAITATLPASPAALEEVTFMDGAKTFNSNALTVNTNGKKLDGATVATKVHTTKGGAFKYIYRNATYGWLLKAFIFMLFALNAHAGDFTYEMNSWEQDSGLSIGTDKLKPRTAGSLLSISDSAGTTVATITTSAMTITTATITGLTAATGSIGTLTSTTGTITGLTAITGSISTLDSSTSQIGTLSLTNALTVPNGGTGLSSLSAGRIPYGAGTGNFQTGAHGYYEEPAANLYPVSRSLVTIDGIYSETPTEMKSGYLFASERYSTLHASGGFLWHRRKDTVWNNMVGISGLQYQSGNSVERVLWDCWHDARNNNGRHRFFGTVGIGISGDEAAKKLEVEDDSGAQVRLSYTAGSAYADFTVDAAGDLAITPSGTKTTLTTVAISGDYLASTGAAGMTTDVIADGIVFRFVSGLLTAINP